MLNTNIKPAVIATIVLLCCSHTLRAQRDARDPRQQRRQFVESLLQTLIESQLNRDPRRTDVQPQVPPQVATAGQHLGEFSTHGTQLVHHLNAHAARNPTAKPLLGDALKLNASISHLRTRAGTARSLEDLHPGFRALDRDWRLLSYRLRRVDDLGDECLRCVRELNELDARLCELLGVSPQLNYGELHGASIAVNTSLAHLIEDLEIELSHSSTVLALCAEAGETHQLGIRFSSAIGQRREHEELVKRFVAFYDSWRTLAVRIRGIGNRHLDRNVRRIDESTLLLHELLWISQPVDYAQLVHLTRRLSADVDRLFDEVSLNVLLELASAERVLPSASEFYGLCENFADSVADQASLEQLRSDYLYLVEAWPELAGCFTTVRRPEVEQSLRAIEESFVVLRDTIGLRPAIDWRRGAELAASLSVLSDRLLSEVQRHIYLRAGYGRQFGLTSVRHANNFRTAAHLLRDSLVSRNEDTMQQQCEQLATAWGKLNEQCFPRLTPAHQQAFGSFRAEITQQVVQLQTMLQL